MVLAQRVAASLERHYGAAAVTLAVQDGAAAGQTVRCAAGGGGGGCLHEQEACALAAATPVTVLCNQPL